MSGSVEQYFGRFVEPWGPSLYTLALLLACAFEIVPARKARPPDYSGVFR